jgi:hypothetical protein
MHYSNIFILLFVVGLLLFLLNRKTEKFVDAIDDHENAINDYTLTNIPSQNDYLLWKNAGSNLQNLYEIQSNLQNDIISLSGDDTIKFETINDIQTLINDVQSGTYITTSQLNTQIKTIQDKIETIQNSDITTGYDGLVKGDLDNIDSKLKTILNNLNSLYTQLSGIDSGSSSWSDFQSNVQQEHNTRETSCESKNVTCYNQAGSNYKAEKAVFQMDGVTCKRVSPSNCGSAPDCSSKSVDCYSSLTGASNYMYRTTQMGKVSQSNEDGDIRCVKQSSCSNKLQPFKNTASNNCVSQSCFGLSGDDDIGYSKFNYGHTWSNTANGDGLFGSCTPIDITTCMSESIAESNANSSNISLSNECLSNSPSNCWTFDGSNYTQINTTGYSFVYDGSNAACVQSSLDSSRCINTATRQEHCQSVFKRDCYRPNDDDNTQYFINTEQGVYGTNTCAYPCTDNTSNTTIPNATNNCTSQQCYVVNGDNTTGYTSSNVGYTWSNVKVNSDSNLWGQCTPNTNNDCLSQAEARSNVSSNNDILRDGCLSRGTYCYVHEETNSNTGMYTYTSNQSYTFNAGQNPACQSSSNADCVGDSNAILEHSDQRYSKTCYSSVSTGDGIYMATIYKPDQSNVDSTNIMFTRNECGDSEGESNDIIPMVQNNCEKPQCYHVVNDGTQYTTSNYGNRNTWEQIDPVGIITNPGIDEIFTYGQCSESLSNCLSSSKASNLANEANACEEPQCWSLVSDAQGLFSASNYGSINTWSNDTCNSNNYGVTCNSNQQQVSELASLCNCVSREPVTCYTSSNDSITYRKNDSYYVLSSDNECQLSNQLCESNGQTIMDQASNNCVTEQCYHIINDGTQYTVSNYGNKHTWSNGSNIDGTYGQCSESLSNCLSLSNASNLANDANACEEPQCWSLVDTEGLFSVSNYGSINTWSNDICNSNDYGVTCYSNQAQVSDLASLCNCESREPVTCYTSSNDSITYRKNDSYYVLSDEVCQLSNQSCESNGQTIMDQASNNCELEQCYHVIDDGTQYTVSNYGNKHTWSNSSNMDGIYGQCTESLSNCLSSIEASNLASLCNCESREPVTCYTSSNDSITYRKNDSYYVLSGDECGLSNKSCESNAQEFIDEARSNCENQICRSGQSNEDGSIISLLNVGYTWSNTSNDDGSFGICTPNADPCLDEIEFSPISYEFNDTSFNIRYGSDQSYGRIIPNDKLSNHVTFGRPLQLKRGALTFTFLQQPIDMTNSFTVVYWAKMYDSTSAKVLITEHVDAILYYSGPFSSCLIEGQTYNDDIWIPRKRNTIEIVKYDSKHGNNQVHHRICTWAKTSASTEQQEWKWEEFPPGNHHGDHNHEFKYNFVSWKKIVISYDKPKKQLTLYHCLDNGTEINKRTIDDVEYTTTAGYLRFHYYNSTYNGGPGSDQGYSRPMFIDGLQIIRGEALTASQTNTYTRDYVYPEASTISGSGSTTNTFDIYCNNNVDVDCYVPVGTTSSYLKKQAYHLLDGRNRCILSQPECIRDVSSIETNLRNACESKSCTVSGTNVGYTWIPDEIETLGKDLRDNNIEIYGKCVANTTGSQVCDELQDYHLNSSDTNYDYSYFTLIETNSKSIDIESNNRNTQKSIIHLAPNNPIKLRHYHALTFRSQPIDMTQSFTVMYWITVPDTTKACVLITEHKDIPLISWGTPVTMRNEDPIWNSRKRNTVELFFYDGKRGGNNHNNEYLRTWARVPNDEDNPQRYITGTPTAYAGRLGGYTTSPARYYDSWRKIAIVHDASANTLTAYHYDASNNLRVKHTTSEIQYTATEGYLQFVYFNALFHADGMQGTSADRPMLIDGVQIFRNRALSQADIVEDNSQPTKTFTEVRSQYYFG